MSNHKTRQGHMSPELDCYPKLHSAHFLLSCDYCDCQEDGGHYCLLHGVQIKNMDTVACDDWTEKDNAGMNLSGD